MTRFILEKAPHMGGGGFLIREVVDEILTIKVHGKIHDKEMAEDVVKFLNCRGDSSCV